MDENEIIWNIINCYYKTNPNFSSKHHLDSYNNFFNREIKDLFREKNPMRIFKNQDSKTGEYQYKCFLYFGGKEGNKIYYGKPIIYDDKKSHFMYPNEARLRNMTYGFSIHYDIDIDFEIKGEGGKAIEVSRTLQKIYLGRFPIMLQSDLCILKGLSREVRFNMGECRNDYGGYFIIDGKEKAIVCQEKFADNMLYISDQEQQSRGIVYSHSAKIRSVSEDASKPIRTLAVRIVAPTDRSRNGQIVVDVPNVKKAVPLFILMRALGVISDKEIIETCLLNIDKEKDYLELFRPSIHDAGYIFTQNAATKYIASFLQLHRAAGGARMQLLTTYLFPHIGEFNFKQKALYLGYIVKRLLDVYMKNEQATDRDNFKFKRIETTGELIGQLFNEYYNLQYKRIFSNIDKEYYYHETSYKNENFLNLIDNNIALIFYEKNGKLVHEGFRKAFKGNWGAQAHTKRLGVVQDLSRLSYFSFLSHLRKLNVPLPGDAAKIVGPRLLHSTQWGKECPIHTPDGGNIGLHKHLSIMTHITSGTSGKPFISWLRNKGMRLLEECSTLYISHTTKVFVNGSWVGVINNPQDIIGSLKAYRRNGLIPIFTSIRWNISRNEIIISTDKGRPMRPVFYALSGDIISWGRDEIIQKIINKKITWQELIMGFHKKKHNINIDNEKIYNSEDIYEFKENHDMLKIYGSVIDYLDTEEEEGSFIAMDRTKMIKNKTTHIEIHPSLIFGIMANQIIFPENNPLPRDLFSCGQSKQAVSLYNSNYQNRIDKMGIILNSGQIPLLKSRYLKIATNEQHPYGENAIVAIACYNGYNVEDAIIVNKAAIDRGLFRTTYFNMYESYEESSEVVGSKVNSKFCDIHNSNVVRLKTGFDYNYLDHHGLIKENTKLNDKIVLIGKCTTDINDPAVFNDSSVLPKRGQLGYVDKSFMTEGEEGFRIAKIRIRHERKPAIGDKFCSRAGQKGTIGIILPEADMPFSKDGIRPDIIVNPHAFPSRMTIGHLIESIVGKACSLYGSFGDCTAFVNKGPKHVMFGKMLIKEGFHSSGTEILYNGMTGVQMETDIYFGPTYYLRLKHMVKDKINYRARGPRTVLTRQTVQGRANNGGLRIGEMDRDAVIGHGMSAFLNESFMERGDEYYVAICNQTGTIAIYNDSKNIFLSPFVDGPLQFVENLEGDLNIKKISRFGRNFSIVRVPFCFKLLYQEMQAMNIQMRIITEDNIDKLKYLQIGDNIEKLTQFKSIHDILNNNIEKLGGKPFTEAEIEDEEEEELETKSSPENVELEEEDEDLEDAIIVFENKDDCLNGINFEVYNPKYPNVKTDTPYALDEQDLLSKILEKFIIRPKSISHVPKEIGLEAEINNKLEIAIFKQWTNDSKKNTLDYLFNKIRSGYHLQIQNNVLKLFTPFYNLHFNNTWSEHLNIDKITNKSKINENREEWTATNCLVQLTFKPLVDNYKMDTFFEVKNMFADLCKHRKIPDVDLFINVKDFPLLKKDLTEPFNHIYNSKTRPIDNPKSNYYPLLSFNSNETFTDIPIPSTHEWQVVTQKIYASRCMTDYQYPKIMINWDDKYATAIFRGTATGCDYTILGNPRLHAAKLDKEWAAIPELNGSVQNSFRYLDAGITKFPNRYKTMEGNADVIHCKSNEYLSNMRSQVSMKEAIPMQDQCKYKYILNIPGNSAAYRLSFLLRSGSLILNVESENKLWWESKWVAMKHYVPVKADLSDLKEKIAWCQSHDAECKKIVANAKTFADNYITKDGIFNYLESIISHILLKQSTEAVVTNVQKDTNIYRVNIIVPFRDSAEKMMGQDRGRHLEIFKNRMAIFLPKVKEHLRQHGINSEFDVTIMEQSKEHSFNRGALLNVGFKEAGVYDAYIFHDVDLIPQDSMIPFYGAKYDSDAIVHFASEWGRYKNPFKYLGGVLLVGREIFEKANGFPNNYFGWGGEDDELRRRFETLMGRDRLARHIKLSGLEGGLTDLENIATAKEKQKILTDKNPVRWEGADKHKETWQANGLNQTDFYEIESTDTTAISNINYKTYIVKLNYEKIKPFERDEKVELQKKQQHGGGKETLCKEDVLEILDPEKTIMFNKEMKERQKTQDELGLDAREQAVGLNKSNQFPPLLSVKEIKSNTEEPNQEEMKIERLKRKSEIGGFQWDETSVNEFLNSGHKKL